MTGQGVHDVPTTDTELVGYNSMRGGMVNLPMKTAVPLEIDPEVRANMRAATRWDYVSEYIGYWIDNKRFWVMAVLFVGAGVLLLDVFAPVALLMIAVGAKYRNMAWMDNFTYSTFGRNRSLVLLE